MIDYREIIRLKSADYSNTSVAASTGSSRNKIADIWKKAQEKQIGWPIPDNLTNEDLKAILYPQEATEQSRLMPDYEYVYNELAKSGVTLSLLWAEYCIKCQDAGKIAYQHTQFNEKYHAYASSKKATLRLTHKPGDELQVDWVGDTIPVTDPLTGLTDPAYVHVHAYEFFGGVTRILIPDNLKVVSSKIRGQN